MKIPLLFLIIYALIINTNCITYDNGLLGSALDKSNLDGRYIIEFPKDEEVYSLEDFLNKMKSDKNFCVTVMRKIAQTATLNNLEDSGFYFDSTKFSNEYNKTPFQIFLKKPSYCSQSPAIHPLQDYSGEPEKGEFGRYFSMAALFGGREDDFFKHTGHAMRFKSRSCNLLIIPKGKYVSLYDFSNKASEEELLDFWNLVHQTLKDIKDGEILLPCGKTSFKIAAHIGSNAAQTVPHFHLRLETR